MVQMINNIPMNQITLPNGQTIWVASNEGIRQGAALMTRRTGGLNAQQVAAAVAPYAPAIQQPSFWQQVGQQVGGTTAAQAAAAAAQQQGYGLTPYSTIPNPQLAFAQGGYGLGGAGSDMVFDASKGGQTGRIVAQLQCDQSIEDEAEALDVREEFSDSDQQRVGSYGRIIEALFARISVEGALPSGHTAETLTNLVIGRSIVTPYIGDVPQEDIPAGAIVSDNFLNKRFGFRGIMDPGSFASLSFRFWSQGKTLPPSSTSYTVSLDIQAVFSRR